MKNCLLALMLLFLAMPAWAEDSPKESTYDRVMRTGTIRCGYGSSKPWIYQDIKAGKIIGLNVEIMEEIAKQLSMKLEWPEETGWANLPTSLNTGRVDVACSLLWTDPERGKQVAFTRPIFYTAIHMYSRVGDKRFTGKTEEINNPNVTISVQDGSIDARLQKMYFSKAKALALPQSASGTEGMLNVATGKADITFSDAIAVKNFKDNNEAKLVKIPLARPVTMYGNSLAVGIHNLEFKEVLDTTVSYLLQTGTIAEIVEKFNKEYPDAVRLPSRPYE